MDVGSFVHRLHILKHSQIAKKSGSIILRTIKTSCQISEKKLIKPEQDIVKAIKTLNWQNKTLYGQLKNKKEKKKISLKEDSECKDNGFNKNKIVLKESGFKDVKISNEKIKHVISESNKTENFGIGEWVREVRVGNNSIPVKLTSLSSIGPGSKCENKIYDQYINSLSNVKQDNSFDFSQCSQIDDGPNISFIKQFPLHPSMKETEPPLPRMQEILKDTNHINYYPGVTTVLNDTMSLNSASLLERWKKKMTKELGEEGFIKYKNDMTTTGSHVHSVIRNHLSGQPPNESELEPKVLSYWKSLSVVLPNITDPEVLERRIKHSQLQYSGVVDCVARYKTNRVLIEWKTAEKPKPLLHNTYDAPLQVAAYVGALAADLEQPLCVERANIVVCYSSGLSAHVFYLDHHMLQVYWWEWLTRLHQFWCNKLRQSGHIQ